MFVFYDTETTGTTTAFDQLLQFAAICTDEALVEVDRFEVRCRLLPFVVPSPGALRVTGLTPGALIDPALPSHTEAVAAIHARLQGWSPAVFFGWNSLRFDEALLRQAFYQTLHAPFLTTTGGNARGDLMRMVQAAHLYAPGAIAVPEDSRGLPSFRLDRIAPANGCGLANAHDALADTEATLELARRLRAHAPDLWDRMVMLTDADRVRRVLDNAAVVNSAWVFSRPYNRLVALCGVNPDYPHELAAFDLAFRPEDYVKAPVDELVAVLNRKQRVIVPLRATRQPLLMPAEAAPSDVGAMRFPEGELARRARQVRGDLAFRERVGEALRRRRLPREVSPHLELRLYERRSGAADAARMTAFHAAPPRERRSIAEAFDDERLRLVARRLIWFDTPELLTADERAARERWIAGRVLSEDPDAPWRTVPAALREAETEIAGSAEPARGFFEDIKVFLEDLADRAAAAQGVPAEH